MAIYRQVYSSDWVPHFEFRSRAWALKCMPVIALFLLCIGSMKAYAGPVYTYKLFGEVEGNPDATAVLDNIDVGTPFTAVIRIDTSHCTSSFLVTCENSVSTEFSFGDQTFSALGSFLAILKDPPYGAGVLYSELALYLPSSTAVIIPMYMGIQLLGDGILGDIGQPPINVKAFESGSFSYSFFYSENPGSVIGEVDLRVALHRVITVQEPAAIWLLVVGLLGLVGLRRRRVKRQRHKE